MRAFHFILLFMFLCKRAKGQNGRSLAFVIDRSPSMELVIDQLRTESIKLAEKIMGEESDIDNLALVVFDDPHVKPIIVNTTDINKFNEHLRGLRTYLDPTNKDCPEKALEALELALQQSNPRSYVFVFTDSSTKDVDLRYKIKELYLSKKSKVFFVLYGKCLDETDEQRTIYSDIAEESSGMVFRINYNETSQIVKGLTFLKNKILPELTVNGVDINKEYDIPVKADRRGYTIIGSGSDLELNVTCSNDCDVKYERINITSRATVHNPQTNIHVSAKGNGDVFVSAYSFKILNYTHGFSIQKPRKMENTEPEPDQYKLNYLAIKLKDSTKVSQIGEAVIMNVTDELYFNLSLEKISDNLYVTEATGFPKTAFKILVKGVDSDTGEKIQGIIDIPENKNYAHTKAFATETETVFLPCKFSSANKTAQWSFERKYPKRESMITVPFSHTITSAGLILPNVNVWHNGRFSCNVPDSPGTTSMYSSDLEVMKNPVLIGHNQETINVNYGSSVTLSCTIEVFPQQRLIWTHSDEKNTNGNKKFTITTGKKDFKITSNLKIKSVTKSETYVCRPKRNQYKIEKIINVVVHGEKPMFEVPSLIKKTHEGNDVQLPCSTIEGKPKPSIRWRRKHKTSNAMEVIETVNSRGTLTLNNVQLSDAGHYICTAENEYGHNEQDTEVIVQAAPKIDKKASVRSGIVGDNNMSLPCSVTGYPAPDVIWRANDTLKLQPDNKYDIRPDNTLIIKHVEHTDAFTSYTCVANNAFGNDTRTFKDVINEIPKFESTTVVTKVMAGENVDIHCSPVEGKPKPKITWRKIDRSTNKSTNLSTSNPQGTLTLNNVQLSDAGHYICTAENVYGHNEQDTKIIVQAAPKIDKKASVRSGIVGDNNMSLPCSVTGYPAPDVIWRANDTLKLQPDNKYDIRPDNTLIIKHVEHTDAFTSYTCVANNAFGNDTRTFKDVINEIPKFESTTVVTKVMAGENVDIHCSPVEGKPKPKITWRKIDRSTNKSTNLSTSNPQGTLTLNNVQLSDAGHYICTAENEYGHDEQDTEVIVQAAPKIDKKASVRSGIVGDSTMSLPCSVTGYPAPDVIWRANDILKLLPDNKYDIRPDNTLIIKHVEHTDAFTSYTCVANNAFGNDTRTFKDVINEIPKFESTTVVTKVMAGENVDIHCSPIEGKPKPKISWRKIDRSTNKSTNLSTSNQGTLTHNNVQLSDAGHYICSAENEYGHDEQDTELIVQVELDLGTVHSKHALENSKLQLDCPTPSTKKYTVRWFKNGNVTNFHDKSLLLKDLKRNSTDKYTCRVSTDLGSTSTTFDLEVGAEPKFQVLKRVDHDGSIKVNWNTQTRLDCDATTHPSINTIEWYHNGHLIVNVTTNETDAMQQDVMEWGQYTCIIKNRHGHLSRTFNVSSDDCFIRENFRSAESNEPLLLTDNKKRPILTKSNRDDKYFLEIPHKTSLKLICPNYDQIKNSFTHIPTKNTLDATCEFEDHFLVNDQLLKFSDIKCSNHVLPQVKETKEPCHENSFNFKIVYLDTNVNLFDVCYDTKNERPVYASAILDHSEKTDAIVSCFGCYSNGSLVRNNDVIGSSVVRENGLKNVNNVLIWNPPKGPHGDSTRRNFHQLESAFHVVALSFEYGLEAWTGVYQYISIDDKVVPKYLWKILRVIEDNAYYVFIYVNHPNESDEDIWCDNEDGLDTDTFQHALDKYTYMCEINQFLEKTKFNITIFKAA